LTEIVEGMVAGEATAVIINELYGQMIKVVKTDSQSAVAILCHDGGSWRTRSCACEQPSLASQLWLANG